MKKIIICICLIALTGGVYGKAIDVITAQNAAYNFLKPKANLQSPSALTLAYTGSSVLNGSSVVDFYIFNEVSGNGFVIVSGDDNAMPVLGYSTESNFATANIIPSVQYLLDNYKKQIAYVIQHNISAPQYIAENWNGLKNNTVASRAARTSSTMVIPMLPCAWDQANEYGSSLTYNADCPYDAAAAPPDQTVTGCVATAMAQVMKYWNWPDTGVGSHTYYPYNPDGLGNQTANFAIAYHFDSMQIPRVTSPNAYVAKLMYSAGVSVNMDYGTAAEGGSGAYVTIGYSPIENCAEFALKTYFRYFAKGYQRERYTQAAWIDSMLNEMNSGRPVIYAGEGSDGGHCWVMDGYDNDTFFHFNWGWSGTSDGFFTVNDIAPPIGDSFNADQEAIIRIVADTPVHSSIVKTSVPISPSSAIAINVFPNPATNTLNISYEGTNITEVTVTDMEGREMHQFTPASKSGMISLPVSGLPNGIYLLRLQTDEGILTRKFVIAK